MKRDKLFQVIFPGKRLDDKPATNLLAQIRAGLL